MIEDANFDNYKTFAFFKPGIDKAEINDIDKRRILRAIEAELLAKGMTKSENPDMLVSMFTKSNQRVDVYNNAWGNGAWGWGWLWRWGWGWGPGYERRKLKWLPQLKACFYIDFIDTNKKELILARFRELDI